MWAPAALPLAAYLVGRSDGGAFAGRVVLDNTAGLYALGGAGPIGGPLGAQISTAASVAFICSSDAASAFSITSVSFGLWIGSYSAVNNGFETSLRVEIWSVDSKSLLPTSRIGAAAGLEFVASSLRPQGSAPALSQFTLAVTPMHFWPVLTGQAFAIVVAFDTAKNQDGGIFIAPQTADPRASAQGPFVPLGVAALSLVAGGWRALAGGAVGALQLLGNASSLVGDTSGGGVAVHVAGGFVGPMVACVTARVRGANPVMVQQIVVHTDSGSGYSGLPPFGINTGTTLRVSAVSALTGYPTLAFPLQGFPDSLVPDQQLEDLMNSGGSPLVWRVDGSGASAAWPPLAPGVVYAICLSTSKSLMPSFDSSFGAFAPTSPASRSSSIALDRLFVQPNGGALTPYDGRGYSIALQLFAAAPAALASQLVINATSRPVMRGSPLADPTGLSDGVGVFFGGSAGARVAVTLAADPAAASVLQALAIVVSAPAPGTYRVSLQLWATSASTGLPAAPLPGFAPLAAVLRVSPSNASVPQLVTFGGPSGPVAASWPSLLPGQRPALVASAVSSTGDAPLPSLRWHFSASGSGTLNASANAAALALSGSLAYSFAGFAVQSSSTPAAAAAAWASGASLFEQEAYTGLGLTLALSTSGRMQAFLDNTGGLASTSVLAATAAPAGAPLSAAPLAVVFLADPAGSSRLNRVTAYVSAAAPGVYQVSATLWACAPSQGVAAPLPTALLAPVGGSNAVATVLAVAATQVGVVLPVVFDVSAAWPLVRGSGGLAPPLAIALTTGASSPPGALQWVLSVSGSVNPGPMVLRGFAAGAAAGGGSGGSSWAPAGTAAGAVGMLTVIGDPTVVESPLLLDTAYGNVAYSPGAAAGLPLGIGADAFSSPAGQSVNTQTAVVFSYAACSTLAAGFVVSGITALVTGPAIAATRTFDWSATLWLCDPRSLAPTTMLAATQIEYNARVTGPAAAFDASPVAVSFRVRDSGSWPLLRPGTTCEFQADGCIAPPPKQPLTEIIDRLPSQTPLRFRAPRPSPPPRTPAASRGPPRRRRSPQWPQRPGPAPARARHSLCSTASRSSPGRAAGRRPS